MDLLLAILEMIACEVLLILAYLVIWVILVPCVFVVATPLIVVRAWISSGGFCENARGCYAAIFRHVRGVPEWLRVRLSLRRPS